MLSKQTHHCYTFLALPSLLLGWHIAEISPLLHHLKINNNVIIIIINEILSPLFHPLKVIDIILILIIKIRLSLQFHLLKCINSVVITSIIIITTTTNVIFKRDS